MRLGDRVTRLDDTRQALHAALASALPYAPDRAHAVPPDQIVAPCMWVDVPSIRVDDLGRGAQFVVSTWPLYLVVDGADPVQVAWLDDGVARMWDQLDALPYTTAVAGNPTAIDAGTGVGTSLRAYVITVDVQHMARTLCLPKLATANPGG